MLVTPMQRFEWDENKARANRRKHGIEFEEALIIFLDDQVLIEQDRFVDDEERWTAIGSVGGAAILVVAHVVREEGIDEVVRIISARKADPKERRRYEQNRSKDI